jgi:hypothetical protein
MVPADKKRGVKSALVLEMEIISEKTALLVRDDGIRILINSLATNVGSDMKLLF